MYKLVTVLIKTDQSLAIERRILLTHTREYNAHFNTTISHHSLNMKNPVQYLMKNYEKYPICYKLVQSYVMYKGTCLKY